MFSVVIVAAGSATRTGLGYNKIFYKIKGKTLIEYSVQYFLKDTDVKEIIIVVSKEDMKQVRSIFSSTKIRYVIGGSTRQKSVFNGLSLVNEEYVLIHDSARPNLNENCISQLKKHVLEKKACILFNPVKDSVVEYKGDTVKRYLNRNNIGLIQTPQAFHSDLIKKAHSLAIKNKHKYMDDASLYRKELSQDVFLIQGGDVNIKATTKKDLALLEELL